MLILFSSSTLKSSQLISYVAPGGNDRNPGTEALPFATIKEAQMTVREAIAKGPDQDIIIRIRKGVYYLDETLQFKPEDSGNENFSVTYETRHIPGKNPLSAEIKKFPDGRKGKMVFGKPLFLKLKMENGLILGMLK